MNIVFYQNCISPHQIPYIKEICNDERVDVVYLITPRIDYSMRKEMGWNAETLLNNTTIKYLLKPSDEQVIQIQQNAPENTFHFFSGIRADSDVYRWFVLSLKYNITRGKITEAPYTYNKPLWAHYLRFWLFDKKYISKIKHVFAIGESAVRYYNNLSNKWNVFPFIYVTERFEKLNPNTAKNNGIIRIVYAGSLSKRKDVITLLKAINKLSNKNKILLDIIGDGTERNKLESFVIGQKLNGIVHFIGVLANDKVNETLQNYDILVLPSKYDGWGAVVNEALTQGLFTLCSDNCGAKLLLQNSRLGFVFKTNNSIDLAKNIEYCIENISNIRNDIMYRKDWSENINGKKIAKYFIDSITNEKVIPPWS